MKKAICVILLALGLITASSAPVYARNPICDQSGIPESALVNIDCVDPEDGNPIHNSPLVRNVLNVVFFVIGLISVFILIYGGIRYILAQGLAAELSQAQHTIIYGVIGLIVSLSAWALVNFVVMNVGNSP
jgi:hypothetical protein